jgi:2-dehydro-3-deoxygluconokinase
LAKVCEELLQAASGKKDITISVDLNYRPRLWQYGVTPLEVMPNLVRYCHLVMGNLWAAEKMLGVPVEMNLSGGKKEHYLEQARRTSERILQEYPRVRRVANTFRFDQGATGIHYYTTWFEEKTLTVSGEYFSDKILDKVGSGDCFMAGLIYGAWRRQPVGETLEFATAAAFQKLFIASDATDQRVEDIKKFMVNEQR